MVIAVTAAGSATSARDNTSLPVIVGTDFASGDLAIAFAYGNQLSPAFSIADSGGNAWFTNGTHVVPSTSPSIQAFFSVITNPLASGVGTVTITSGSANELAATVAKATGLAKYKNEDEQFLAGAGTVSTGVSRSFPNVTFGFTGEISGTFTEDAAFTNLYNITTGSTLRATLGHLIQAATTAGVSYNPTRTGSNGIAVISFDLLLPISYSREQRLSYLRM